MKAVLACALGLVLAVAARAQSPVSALNQVWWGLAVPSDAALLRARAPGVNRLLDDFDIAQRDWSIRELQAPLLRRHAVFEFVGADRQGLRSEFVLILDRDAPPGAAPDGLVVPLLYSGAGHESPQLDLNTVGVFNRMMQREAFQPARPGDWLQLAEIYLSLAGDQPQPLDDANLGAVRAALPKRWQAAPPALRLLPGGGVELRFDSITSPSVYGVANLAAWVFDFDAHGLLRSLQAPLWTPFD